MQNIIQKYLESGNEDMPFAEFQRLAHLGETRYIERKSIKLFRDAKQNKNHIKALLAKEVSAFANYDGGLILVGVSDDGKIEEGIENKFGKGSFKEWIEDIVFMTTSPSVEKYAVKVVKDNNKYLFAIIVGSSTLAPHQSAEDHKYYGRIEGKSKPIDGLMVNDIFHRQHHLQLKPCIELKSVNNQSPTKAILEFGITNTSRICAEKALAVITLDFPKKIMNGGYHSGQNVFSENKAQLYADIIYPQFTHSFQNVNLRDFTHLYMQVALVSRNSLQQIFSFIIEKHQSNFTIAHIEPHEYKRLVEAAKNV